MRFAVVIGLLLSLVILGNGVLQNWKEIPIPEMPQVPEKKRTPVVGETQNFEFNPTVPAILPDLNEGYLFNAEREIAETEEKGQSTVADEVDQGTSQVDMNTLVYVGSIIIGDLRKGMVSFSVKRPQPAAQLRRPRRGRPIARPPTRKGAAMENATVDQGDDFYGFKVSLVQPDRILFSKNGTNIEKPLFDPNKERAEPAPMTRPAVGGGRPAPTVPGRAGQAANVPNAIGGATPAQQATGVPPEPGRGMPAGLPGRVIQPVPVPEEPATPDVNSTRVGASSSSSASVAGARRTVQRPRVILRRKLPAAQTR